MKRKPKQPLIFAIAEAMFLSGLKAPPTKRSKELKRCFDCYIKTLDARMK
jgi:hypothetical protein